MKTNKILGALVVVAICCMAFAFAASGTDAANGTIHAVDITGFSNASESGESIANTAIEGTAFTGTVTAATGYVLPATIEVKVGTTILTPRASTYTWIKSSGQFTIEGSAITGDVAIKIVGVKETFTFTSSALVNASVVQKNLAPIYKENLSFTIATADSFGYNFPVTTGEGALAITNGGVALTYNTDYTYDVNTGAVVIKADKITGDIVVTGTAVAKTYAIDDTITDGTGSFTATTLYKTSITGTITPGTGFKVPESVKVTVGISATGLADITNKCIYNASTGSLTIPAAYVTEKVTITAKCDVITYKMTDSISNGKVNWNKTVPTNGADFVFTITANKGFQLPAADDSNLAEKLVVKKGMTALVKSDSVYTYTIANGVATVTVNSASVTGDIQIFLSCDPITYNLTYDKDGGSATLDNLTGTAYGRAIALPSPGTKTDMIFGGWVFTATGNSTSTFAGMNGDSYVPTANGQLKAKWNDKTATVYTVSFDANGGSVINAQPVVNNATVDNDGRIISPVTPVKTGFAFGGWYTSATAATRFVEATNVVEANITLYAKWTEDTTVEKCTVTFKSNGGTSIASVKVISGETVVLPANPAKSGNSFRGWFTDIALTRAFVASETIDGDLTLYAKWTATGSGFPGSDSPDGPDGEVAKKTNWVGIALLALGIIGTLVILVTPLPKPIAIITLIVAVLGVVLLAKGYYSFGELIEAIRNIKIKF